MRTARALNREPQPQLVEPHDTTFDHEHLIDTRPPSVSSAHTFNKCGRRRKRRAPVAVRKACVRVEVCGKL